MNQRVSSFFKLIFIVSAGLSGFFLAKQYYKWANLRDQIYFIEGCKYFNPEEVNQIMEKAKSENEYLTLHIIQQYVLSLPWVQDCNIRYHLTSSKNIYPHNTIWIHIKEKKPVAKTFDNTLLLDDSSGLHDHQVLFMSKLVKVNVIEPADEVLFFIKTLDANPEIKTLIEACYYVRPGRWNLVMQDNKIIKLQEDFSFLNFSFADSSFTLRESNDESNTKTNHQTDGQDTKQHTKENNQIDYIKEKIALSKSINLLTLKNFMSKYPEEYNQANEIDFRKPGYAIIEEQKQSVNDIINQAITNTQ